MNRAQQTKFDAYAAALSPRHRQFLRCAVERLATGPVANDALGPRPFIEEITADLLACGLAELDENGTLKISAG